MPTAIPTTFDALFDRYRGRIPKAYLRALTWKESGMNPLAHEGTSGRGLLQITGVVRSDYNRLHEASVGLADLFKPEVSVEIASDLLHRIVGAYGKHPSPNMKEDWTNPEFVKLVTMGWNAGYSEGGGVGKVAGYLERKGLPVTHDNVYRYASTAGAVAKLGNTKARDWQRGVLSLYQAQPDWIGRAGRLTTILLALGVGLAAYKLKIFS